jgi:hypothetical protein
MKELVLPYLGDNAYHHFLTYTPTNLRVLNLANFGIQPMHVPSLLRYLSKATLLEILDIRSDEPSDESDDVLCDILLAISKLPVHSFCFRALNLGQRGCDDLCRYIKKVKYLYRIELMAQDSLVTSTNSRVNQLLDALSTRSDVQVVFLLFEQDNVDVNKLRSFFEKTVRSLLISRFHVRNLDEVDSNSEALIDILWENEHILSAFIVDDQPTRYNLEAVEIYERSFARDYEKKLDFPVLISRLRCIAGSRRKQKSRRFIPFAIIVQIVLESIHSYQMGIWHAWSFKAITKCLLDRRTLGTLKFPQAFLLKGRILTKVRCINCDMHYACTRAVATLS